jgi:Flp pilus assembly protein TadD
VAFEKSREVFLANTVTAAGDEMAHQRRINDYIKELEDQRLMYDQPGRNAASPAARVYLQRLDTQIIAMKDARHRTSSGPEPTPGWMSLALGSAYFRADATADAEREYRAALAVDPKLGEAHNNLAVVCMLTGRYPEADAEIKAAEKAGFRVNPQLKEDLKNASARR